jgi:copper oxidase (laccase) domain-containing protein
MVAGIRAALDASGAALVDVVDVCTACGGGQYSHRARGDAGRQALVVWSTPGVTP